MSASRGIQLSRLMALRSILVDARNGVTVAEVARRLEVSKATATRYLLEFEAQHLARPVVTAEHKQRQVWRAA